MNLKITTLFLILIINQTYALESEFISLDQKANYEKGSLKIADKEIELSYMGTVLFKKTAQLGIGLFNQTSQYPILLMSSSELFIPDFKTIRVNIPDKENHYICTDLTNKEQNSTQIKDYIVIIIKGNKCKGQGANKGKTINIEFKLTESLFVGGASRIDIKNGIAYLNTIVEIDKNTALYGALGTRTYNQIFDLITNHPEIATLVEGQISGSIHDEINVQTACLIRKSGLNIHLQSTSDISSGGVDLFISGNRRTMDDGAIVGVHSWALGIDDEADYIEGFNLVMNDPLHFTDIGVPFTTEMLGENFGKEFYFFTVYAAPAADIYQMSRSELEKFGILSNDITANKREEKIKILLDWAENQFSNLFSPSKAILQQNGHWLYAYYGVQKNYIGVNDQDEIWILGDEFGGLVYIDKLDKFIENIEF